MRIRELRRKEVINITDGGRLGFVGDVDLRMPDGQTAALIVYGPARFFGLFGRGEEYYVPWDSIQRIGDDIILIDKPAQHRDPALERRRLIKNSSTWNFRRNAENFTYFLEIILAIRFTLCYDNSAFRMAADSLFVPICKKRVSRGEETARGTN